MSRGKEYKGQTLVVDGSKSGSSIVVTRLAYDSAFNLEFIGEARYGSAESDQYWYIEKLAYDSAFNLETIQTAQNRRFLGTSSDTVTILPDNIIMVSDNIIISDLAINDKLNSLLITAINDREITLSGVLSTEETIPANEITVTLENYTTKDFNKRAWVLRELYIYE